MTTTICFYGKTIVGLTRLGIHADYGDTYNEAWKIGEKIYASPKIPSELYPELIKIGSELQQEWDEIKAISDRTERFHATQEWQIKLLHIDATY